MIFRWFSMVFLIQLKKSVLWFHTIVEILLTIQLRKDAALLEDNRRGALCNNQLDDIWREFKKMQ